MENRVMEPRLKEIRSDLLSGENDFLAKVYGNCATYCKGYLVTKKKCNSQLAEDIFNESILILRKNIIEEKVIELSSLRGYLVGICSNVHNQLLSKARRDEDKQEQVKLHLYEMNLGLEEDQIHQLEIMADISANSLHAIDEKCQKILKHFYFDGLTMSEIADTMGFASQNVAKTMKSRCYKKLMIEAKRLINKYNNG